MLRRLSHAGGGAQNWSGGTPLSSAPWWRVRADSAALETLHIGFMDGLDIFDDPTETLRQALNELNELIDAGQEASSSSRFAQAWRQRDCILLELEERNASEAVLAPMLQASVAQPHARAREPPRSITTPAAPTRLLPAAAPPATVAHQQVF